MAYQTLYRKYRPRSFEDIVGQKNIVKVLSNAVIHSKIAHAYLFCGPRGTGKTSMAKIFAKIVNCQNLNGTEPCGHCICCKQIEDKSFMDIIEIDAASNNGVDEIREIKNKVNLAPNSGKYKVYIIDEVHMLSIGAFNALLKTLEEPPAHIIFILATTEPHKLPITVISRCQRFDFKKFLNSEIVENLKKICSQENISLSDDILNEIAILSDGGMRDAIGLLDQLSLYSNGDVVIEDLYQLSGNLSTVNEIDFLKHYFSNDISFCFDSLRNFESNGKNFGKIASDFVNILDSILKYKIIDNYSNSNDINYKDDYLLLSSMVSREKISSLIQKICDVEKNVKNSSNPRILFEIALLMEYGVPDDTSTKSKIVEKNVKNISKKNDNNHSKLDNKNENDIIKSKYFDFSLNSDQISELHNIRINNTFYDASKTVLNDLKNKLSLIMNYMFDDNYGFLVLNLQDCELRVAGSKNVIISVELPSTAEILNEKIYLLDELISKTFGTQYKCFVVSNSDWNTIKKEYVASLNTNKTYDYIEEINYFSENLNKNKKNTDLEGIFGNEVNDIIEIG